MKAKSEMFEQARCIAFHHENLMPVDCIDILESIYGKRLLNMRPKTIREMVRSMMQTWIDTANIIDDIEESVQDWCNSY